MYIYILELSWHIKTSNIQESAQIPAPNIKATTPLEFSLPSKRLDPLQDLQGVLPSSGTLQCAGAQTWQVGFYHIGDVVYIIYILAAIFIYVNISNIYIYIYMLSKYIYTSICGKWTIQTLSNVYHWCPQQDHHVEAVEGGTVGVYVVQYRVGYHNPRHREPKNHPFLN